MIGMGVRKEYDVYMTPLTWHGELDVAAQPPYYAIAAVNGYPTKRIFAYDATTLHARLQAWLSDPLQVEP